MNRSVRTRTMKILKMTREDPPHQGLGTALRGSSVFLKNDSLKPPRGALRGGGPHH